jgi:hypothetical protein
VTPRPAATGEPPDAPRALPDVPLHTLTGRFSSLALRYRRVTPLGDRIATALFSLGGLAFAGVFLRLSVDRLREDPQALLYAAALGALFVCGACIWNLAHLLRPAFTRGTRHSDAPP